MNNQQQRERFDFFNKAINDPDQKPGVIMYIMELEGKVQSTQTEFNVFRVNCEQMVSHAIGLLIF